MAAGRASRGPAPHGWLARYLDYLTVEKGLEQLVVVLGIVLQIGILDNDEITAGVFQARADCGPLALISLMVQDPEIARFLFSPQYIP